jgi:hypothetical protein
LRLYGSARTQRLDIAINAKRQVADAATPRDEMVDGSAAMWTLILVTVIFSGSVVGGVAGNTAFLDFPNEGKCRAAAGVMEASERVAISAARPGQTNISPPAYYRIIARCIER